MNSTLMLVNGRLNNRSEKSGAGGGNALPPGGEKSGGGNARGGEKSGGGKVRGGKCPFPVAPLLIVHVCSSLSAFCCLSDVVLK